MSNSLNRMYYHLLNRAEETGGDFRDEDLNTRVRDTLDILSEMGDDGRLKMVETQWVNKVEELIDEVDGEEEDGPYWNFVEEECDYCSNTLEECYNQNVFGYEENLLFCKTFEDGIGELIKKFNRMNGTNYTFTH